MADTQLDDDRFTPASIRQQERSARQPDAPASDQEAYDRELGDMASHYDESAPEPQLYSGGGGGGGKKKGLRARAGKAAGLLKNKKFKLIAGGLGVSLPLIVSLLLQISSLLFPNITAHIDGNRMRRLTRQFVDSTDTIISQKVALDTTSDQAYKDALDTYRDDGTGLFSRINRLRPVKVAEQMLLDMEFVYGNPTKIPGTGLTREKLVAVKINGETIPLPENSRGIVGKVIHPIDYLQARMRSKVAFRTALGVNGRLASLVTTRGRAAKLVREKIGGVRMYRWTKDEVDKATREAADPEKLKLEALKESYKVATADGDAETRAAQGTHSDDIKEATAKAAEAEAQCVENPDCLEQLSRSGTGIAPTVDEIVTNSFKPTAIKTAMHTIGTVYDVASILCLMYDSTVQSSLGVMEAYTAESVRTYHSMAAASDAQIYTQTHPSDPRTNLKLTGAYAAQLGDAEDSIPEQRANTGVGDTSETPSPLGSAAGLYGTDALGNFLSSVNSG
ncbi:MAG TPA: hypothetical protein VL737_04105, partial [Candidatus Pristimantibacillus sp.]|nr:hypothetical protein [Candidatus Pristimantibacillus sp.]